MRGERCTGAGIYLGQGRGRGRGGSGSGGLGAESRMVCSCSCSCSRSSAGYSSSIKLNTRAVYKCAYSPTFPPFKSSPYLGFEKVFVLSSEFTRWREVQGTLKSPVLRTFPRSVGRYGRAHVGTYQPWSTVRRRGQGAKEIHLLAFWREEIYVVDGGLRWVV